MKNGVKNIQTAGYNGACMVYILTNQNDFRETFHHRRTVSSTKVQGSVLGEITLCNDLQTYPASIMQRPNLPMCMHTQSPSAHQNTAISLESNMWLIGFTVV